MPGMDGYATMPAMRSLDAFAYTPEFAFEHVTSNIASQANALGVKYPPIPRSRFTFV
jgi:hypothetical protein